MNHFASAAHPSTAARNHARHAPPEPAGRGRPSRRTPELVQALCALIRTEGIADSAAGVLVGVSTSTLSRWKREDEDFVLALDQARALFERERLRVVRDALKRDGTPDWRAAAWLLQNSSAEGYRRRSKKESDGETVTREEVERMVQESLRERLAELTGVHERPTAQNGGCVPEIPENGEWTVARGNFEEEEEEEEEGAAHVEIGGIVPIIPENPARTGGAPAAPRLSRRERRAEERQRARELKELRKTA